MTPIELEQHNCLVHSLKAPTGMWTFTDRDERVHVVRVAGSFSSNLGESIQRMAKLGHGISMHPRYMVENDLRENRLQEILTDYRSEGLDIYAIAQSKRHLPYKVRLFVDHLRQWFKHAEWKQS